MASIHDVFERRLQRHIDKAADRLAEAQRGVMASYSAKGLLNSGPRLKRQAQVRNEAVADIMNWCLCEVMDFSKANGMRPQVHGQQVRPALEAFMLSSRGSFSFQQFGPAAANAIVDIMDKADAHIAAELDEFAVGAWRPKPTEGGSVTNNSVVNNGGSIGNLQQGGDGAQQQIVTTADIQALTQALEAFAEAAQSAPVAPEVRAAISVEIETIRPQLNKPTPSAVIVREGLKSLRNVLEGVAGGLLTPQFAALMAAAMPLIGAG